MMGSSNRFPLGQLYISRGIRDAVPLHEVVDVIRRHHMGDWSEMSKDDAAANEEAIKHGSRVFSAYELEDGKRCWVITEADRSATTLIFPDEY